jgi:hypothetical protein
MPTYEITSSTFSTYNLAAGDGLLVTRTGAIGAAADNAHGLLGVGGNTVAIEGYVGARGLASDGAHFDGPNNVVTVATGGTISSEEDDGVEFAAGSSVFTNRGLIYGGTAGIRFTAGSAAVNTNYGTIVGGVDGIDGVDLNLVNFGTIESLYGDGIDAYAGLNGSNITNNGSIYGRGDNGLELSQIGNDVVVNNGYIYSLNGITLHGGADTYDGRLGQVVGGVYGGPSNDTLRGGAFVDVFDGGADNDFLFGGGAADQLSGGSGNDQLNGEAGVDNMVGGTGNDIYVVDNAGDVIVEAVGEGNDQIIAASTYTLAAGVEVELIRTINQAATTALNLIGNEFSQTLIGNAGANNLVGGGGNDVLRGFGGNDNYFVDSQSDIIDEVAGGGTADRVYTVGTFVLAADDNIEFLATTNAASTAAINLVGNALSQTITGNAGVNAIYGGLGNDTLLGLGGSDIFVFNTALGASNVDTLSDFTAADTVYLENAVFTALTGTGTMTANQFVSNTTGLATTASQRIIYESDTGNLYYDSNGNAAGGSVLFARLGAGLAITNADFFII